MSPSVDLYEQISCPLTFVLASRGFYVERSTEVRAAVAARPERVLLDIDSNHNVPMTRPDELGGIILGVVNRVRPR